MPKSRLSRRKLLAGAAPLVAAPALSKLMLDGKASAAGHSGHGGHMLAGAAMVGEGTPAPGGPHDLDDLLYPPTALPYRPGRVREYAIVAHDREVEIAPG